MQVKLLIAKAYASLWTFQGCIGVEICFKHSSFNEPPWENALEQEVRSDCHPTSQAGGSSPISPLSAPSVLPFSSSLTSLCCLAGLEEGGSALCQAESFIKLVRTNLPPRTEYTWWRHSPANGVKSRLAWKCLSSFLHTRDCHAGLGFTSAAEHPLKSPASLCSHQEDVWFALLFYNWE